MDIIADVLKLSGIACLNNALSICFELQIVKRGKEIGKGRLKFGSLIVGVGVCVTCGLGVGGRFGDIQEPSGRTLG